MLGSLPSVIVFPYPAPSRATSPTASRRKRHIVLLDDRGVKPGCCTRENVAIAVHADEQCENRCGFVAAHFAAVISARREIKIVSAEYRDYQKQFRFRTNS
jgi:hypothetical protein